MTKKTPSKRPSFGNSVPAGEVHELGESTGWAAWNEAVDKTEKQFQPTAPMTAAHPPEPGVDRRYAKTRPASLSTEREQPASRRPRALTADEVMTEARKNNRVCPKPRQWVQLFGQIPQWAPGVHDLPAAPLTGDNWHRTPALSKRMAFRDHIEWCEKHGCLVQMLGALRGLAEDDWHHMGD